NGRPTAPDSPLLPVRVRAVLAVAGEYGQLGEIDLGAGAGGLVVGGGDQAQVVDAGGRRRGGGGLGDGPVHVPAGDERHGAPGGLTVQVDLDAGQVFGVIAQLDPPAHERRVDGVGVAFQRHGGGT